MTESEELQKNADQQYRMQRYAELNAYMDTLMVRIEKDLRASLWSGLYALIAFIGMMILSLVSDTLSSIAMVAYFVVLAYSVYTDRVAAKSMSELEGAIRVLKILGLTDIDWDNIGRTRRRRVWSSLTDTVKGWVTKKEKVQKEAYQPA